MSRRVLSICTGLGLLDRAFKDVGFEVIAGCEVDPHVRGFHDQVVGGAYLTHDLKDLPPLVQGQHFEGIIGGPPCQSHSKLKTFRDPKFPDETPNVRRLLAAASCDWFLFENVKPTKLANAQAVMLNAMHFGKPHQSRERWFTFKGLTVPRPIYRGDVNDLMAYPIVVGKAYGPIRAARLQGYPPAADLEGCRAALQIALSNCVHYDVARAWAERAWATNPQKAAA